MSLVQLLKIRIACLERVGKLVHAEYISNGGVHSLAFEDAMRQLEAVLYGPGTQQPSEDPEKR